MVPLNHPGYWQQENFVLFLFRGFGNFFQTVRKTDLSGSFLLMWKRAVRAFKGLIPRNVETGELVSGFLFEWQQGGSCDGERISRIAGGRFFTAPTT